MSNINKDFDIELRQISMSDIDGLIELCNNVDLTYTSRTIPQPYTKEDAENWIKTVESEKYKNYYYCIYFEGKVVGSISLKLQSGLYEHSAELGYIMHNDYRNKGIMTKAVYKVLDIGFYQLHLHRIYANVFKDNKASRRVMSKLGFNFEGLFEDGIYLDGEFFDYCVYSQVFPE